MISSVTTSIARANVNTELHTIQGIVQGDDAALALIANTLCFTEKAPPQTRYEGHLYAGTLDTLFHTYRAQVWQGRGNDAPPHYRLITCGIFAAIALLQLTAGEGSLDGVVEWLDEARLNRPADELLDAVDTEGHPAL